MTSQTIGNEKLELLRQLELEAYRTAYHVVRDEKSAVEAVRSAMIMLCRQGGALDAGDELLRKRMRMHVMKCCIPFIQAHMAHGTEESRFG